jgi:hypothetical protein
MDGINSRFQMVSNGNKQETSLDNVVSRFRFPYINNKETTI